MRSSDDPTTEKNTPASNSATGFHEENMNGLQYASKWASENETSSQRSERLGNEEDCYSTSEEIENLNNMNVEVVALELVEENRLLMKAIQKGRRKYCYVQKDLEVSEAKQKACKKEMQVRLSPLKIHKFCSQKNTKCLLSNSNKSLVPLLQGWFAYSLAWLNENKLHNLLSNIYFQKLLDQARNDKVAIHEFQHNISDLEEANRRLETDLNHMKNCTQEIEKDASKSKSLLCILEAENSDLKGVLKNTRYARPMNAPKL